MFSEPRVVFPSVPGEHAPPESSVPETEQPTQIPAPHDTQPLSNTSTPVSLQPPEKNEKKRPREEGQGIPGGTASLQKEGGTKKKKKNKLSSLKKVCRIKL